MSLEKQLERLKLKLDALEDIHVIDAHHDLLALKQRAAG